MKGSKHLRPYPRPRFESIGKRCSKVVNAHARVAFLPALVHHLKHSFQIASNLKYSTQVRRARAYLTGTFSLAHPIERNRLNVLLVGYGEYSYDAQFLRKLGYSINLYHLDFRDFSGVNVIEASSFESFHPLHADVCSLPKITGLPDFDYIFLSRACVDNFEFSQAIVVLNAALRRLRDENSVMLAHFQTLFLTRDILRELEEGGGGEKCWCRDLLIISR